MQPSTDDELRLAPVLRLRELESAALVQLLSRYGLETQVVPDEEEIPGSYWGDSEAGLIGNRLYVRGDTPLHSILHEAAHYICMDEQRRSALERDAGGEYAEEDAVCYLQIVLADHVSGAGRARMQSDMDAWGYTFRLGSARAWFERDAQEAHAWLAGHGLIDAAGQVTWRVRS